MCVIYIDIWIYRIQYISKYLTIDNLNENRILGTTDSSLSDQLAYQLHFLNLIN